MKPVARVAFVLLWLVSVSVIAHPRIDVGKLDRLFDALEKNDRMMGSITLTRNGVVIYDRAIGFSKVDGDDRVRTDSNTIFRIGSITKVYTAVMIWQLIEEGTLSPETRLSEFFPGIAAADRITIAHLLSHTSGLRDYTMEIVHDDPESWAFSLQSSKEMISRIARLEADFAPGEKNRYSNTNYTLLGYIVEMATGSTYGEQLDKRIVGKLGLKRTRYDGKIAPEKNEAYSYVYENGQWNRSHEEDLSVAAGAGGIVSSTSDMALFITALGEHKLISETSLQKMTAAFSDAFPDSHHGISLFTLRGIGKKAISKQGGIDAFSSNIVYVPDDGLALALAINGNNYPMSKIFWSAMDIYYDRPVEVPSFSTVELSKQMLTQYEGAFILSGSAMEIAVKRDGASLSAQATGQDRFSLEPIGKSTFANKPSGIIVEFVRTPAGAIGSFTLHQGRNTSTWEKATE